MTYSKNPEQEIFLAALDLKTPAERAAFLKGACGDNEPLRAQVQALLDAHDDGDDLLECPPLGATAAYLPIAEGTGTQVGPYKLLQQIGEGGFGVVYMAEQLEPVRRKVALKIIKPGMDTKEVIARFESERQALALMDHPNIARVLDAGATQSGRPYFVMELVKGVPITEYCDKSNLPAEHRLALFVTVCHAVQHAHQKGVIHRDIKPTNILVTLHDGVPVPKVIDFGVAKATSQQLTARTLFTQYGQMIGTPVYMSPEQAEMSGLDIDTRSDIYSLGVLLYELLTGTTPFDAKRLLAAGYAEMQRIIREEEPLRPSTRFSTMADSAVVSSHRGTDAKRLTQLLRGDLDVIVMKALDKDRNRRYDSPNSFAADIERFLRREPVLARAPSFFYRVSKFTQRNRKTVAVGAVVSILMFLALLNHFVGYLRLKEARGRAYAEMNRATIAEAEAIERLLEVTRQKERAVAAEQAAQAERDRSVAAEREAQQQRERAERERDITKAVTDFMEQDLLGRLNPGTPERPGFDPNLPMRMFLDFMAGTDFEEEFRDRPLVEAALRQLLGHMYRAFGSLALAESQLQKCLEIRRRELGDENPDTLTAMHNLGLICEAQRLYEKAEPYCAAAVAGRRRTLGDDHPDTLTSINNLAAIYHAQRKFEESEPLYKEALAGRRRGLGDVHVLTLRSMTNLAQMYRDRGQIEMAEPIMDEMLEITRRGLGDENPATVQMMRHTALTYRSHGRLDKVESLYAEALKIQRRTLGDDHADTLESMHALAYTYHARGKLTDAISLAEEAVRRRTETLGPHNSQTCFSMNNLAWMYRDTGRIPDAAMLHEAALDGLRRSLGPDHRETLTAMNSLASSYMAAHRISDSIALLEESLTRRRATAADDLETFAKMTELAAIYQTEGRLAESLELREEALKRRRERIPDDSVTVDWMHHLALAYLENGRAAKAEPIYCELLDLWQKLDADQANLASIRAQLGMCLYEQEKYVEAEPHLRASLAVREQENPNHWITFNNKSLLGGSLLGQARALMNTDRAAAMEKLAAAERLLVEGHEGLKSHESRIPIPTRLLESLDRLVHLYETSGQAGRMATVRAERDRLFGGFVHEWLVVSAPIPIENCTHDTAVDKQQVAGEASLKPRDGEQLTKMLPGSNKDAPLIWKKHSNEHYFIDFRTLFEGQRTFHSVAYAACYVVSDAEHTDLVLNVGSDDQAKVYLNGEELMRNPAGRVLVRDQDQVRNVALRRGTNILIFKVVNQTGGWQGCVRFTDKSGQPAQGLVFQASP